MVENESQAQRSEERNEAYKFLLKKYIEQTNDTDVKILLKWLNTSIELPDSMNLSHFIMFRIRDEELLHESQSVKSYWEDYIKPKEEKNSLVVPCMFCQKMSSVLDRHSIHFLIGPDRTKMISANKNAYESHGLKNSHSAPTCYTCEQKYGKALEFLLQKYKDKAKTGGPHMFRIGDITYVYWLRGKQQIDDLLSVFASPTEKQTPEDMRDLLNQAFKGISIKRDTNDFCLLSLSSNKGRLVVRDYVEDSVGNIKDRLEIFFEAQNLENKRFYGIYTLASTMYKEPRTQMQKYSLEEWIGWFLYGRKLSGRILLPILKRIQAQGVMYPHHGAAIKSWLISQNEGVEWSVKVDENNNSSAYVTGRVFAILERIQHEATSSDNTIASKFFGSASTTPRSIMGMLIRNAQHHLTKLNNTSEKRGIAINLERRLGQALQLIENFPTTLKLEKQGEFSLGYYHERQSFFTPKTEGEK